MPHILKASFAKPISANLLLRIMASTPAKVIGGLLLVAGIAAFAVGSLGVLGVITGLAGALAYATAITGATVSWTAALGLFFKGKESRQGVPEGSLLNDMPALR